MIQEQQLGTGHAVAQAMTSIGEDSTVLVLYGDVPLTGHKHHWIYYKSRRTQYGY